MSKILEKLEEYGVDVKIVMERFVDDADLYEDCLYQFVDDQCFAQLESALKAEDYTAAFENAHTLKGVSGNLGLTPMFNQVTALVESLRGKNYANLEAEYKSITSELKSVKEILAQCKAD